MDDSVIALEDGCGLTLSAHSGTSMFRYSCLIIMVLLGAGAFPQSGTPVPTGSASLPSGQYKIQGTVVNAVTGHPIARALVELYLEGRRAMLTGAEGEFVFDKLPEEGAM